MFFENTSVGILKNTAKHKDRTKISNYFFRFKADKQKNHTFTRLATRLSILILLYFQRIGSCI
jgi:hypothetical protein